MTVLDERVIVLPEANPGLPLKGDFERMARKRFQHGQLILRGGRHPVWVGRWREDVIRDGKIERVHMCETLGTKTGPFSPDLTGMVNSFLSLFVYVVEGV
jgi:hypothetical protein